MAGSRVVERMPPGPETEQPRRTWRNDVLVLALAAVALRLPAFLASRHVSYDDGFFGLSAIELRRGVLPYRELFSPQGPLHLPLLFAADLLGFRTRQAPRLLPLLAGVGVTVLAYVAARRITSRYGAIIAAVLVTTSGSVLWVTSGIAADGPGLAFALAAVTVGLLYSQAPTSRRALGAGALVGAAVATKALTAPAGLAVALLLLRRGRVRDLAYAVLGGIAVVVAVSLPWGAGRVWDQSVTYNREAKRLTSYGGATSKILHTLFDRDLLVLGAAGIVVVVLVTAWARQTERAGAGSGRRAQTRSLLFQPAAALSIWLAAEFGLLVYEPALWRPHVAHLIPPLALLIALRPPPLAALVAGALLIAPWYAGNLQPVLWPHPYDRRERAAIAALRALPAGAKAITDEPGYLWRAGRLTDPYLDDSSIKRIELRQITTRRVVDGARKHDVCAVLVWSDRYRRLRLGPALERAGYEVTARYGGPRVLYEKRNCHP